MRTACTALCWRARLRELELLSHAVGLRVDVGLSAQEFKGTSAELGSERFTGGLYRDYIGSLLKGY